VSELYNVSLATIAETTTAAAQELFKLNSL
jgi:Tat protein secretion system quality control protein TatD with DNase activity